jgi:hypothetical protein
VYQVIASVIYVIASIEVVEVRLVYQVITSIIYVVASVGVIEVCFVD